MGQKAGNYFQFIHLITGLRSPAVNKSCTSAETLSLAAEPSVSGQVEEEFLYTDCLSLINGVRHEDGKLLGV